MLVLLMLALTSGMQLTEQILTDINVNYHKITGVRDHFTLQSTGWLERSSETGTIQAVLLLNASDTHTLSLHYFEYDSTSDVELRITSMRQHSSPARLELDVDDAGKIQEAVSNSTNSTLSPMVFLDEGSKQELLMQPYIPADPLHFTLLSRDFLDTGMIYYTASFENCTGDRYHYLTMRNESSLMYTSGVLKRTGVIGVLGAFFGAVMLTFGVMVWYWRKYDTLPCQKRKEESARQVLDSNRAKSSV